jgi:hypothetical protein
MTRLAMLAPLMALLSPASAGPGSAPDSGARGADPTPVLVELFTSEGCSSCPSADALLARLAREQPVQGARILLLGQHVTYWDRLGWRDRFSSAAATARQEAYAERLSRGSVYTPQAVVDGTAEAVGSDRTALLRLVGEAARRPKGSVRIAPLEGGRVEILASWEAGVEADVFVAAVLPAAETRVQSGENAGRTLVHASVVARQWKAGAGRGGFRAEIARPRSPHGPVALVAFVQEPRAGRVLAAGEEGAPAAGGR